MNRKQKRAGGSRRPPQEGLIQRKDVARILQRDRRSVFRYEQEGRLTVVCKTGGTKWFSLEEVVRLAAELAGENQGRSGRKNSRRREAIAAAAPAPQAKEKAYDPPTPVYDPALRSRRAPSDETPKAPPPAPEQRQRSKEEKAPRPLPVGDPRWFDEDWTPPTPPDRDDDAPKSED